MKGKVITFSVLVILITAVSIAGATEYNLSDRQLINTVDNGNVEGIEWGPNGDNVYLEGTQFSVSESYNISSIGSSVGSVSGSSGGEFNDDGTMFFIYRNSDDTLLSYSLSTPYDLSTSTLESSNQLQTYDEGSGGFTSPNNVRDLTFNDDGTSLFVGDIGYISVSRYELSTPYDVDTASPNSSGSIDNFEVNGDFVQPINIAFNNDGSKFYISDNSIGRVIQFSLTSNYDITSRSVDTTISESSSWGIDFANDGIYFYHAESQSTNQIRQYQLVDSVVSGTVVDESGSPVNNAEIYVNGSLNATTNANGEYQFGISNGDYTVTSSKEGFINNSTDITVSGANIELDFVLFEEKEFNLDVNPWMAHGSTQPYEVTFGGEVVTSESNVSSSNSTIINVSESNNTLTATNDTSISKQVTITAEYQGDVTTRTVTVANRTIDNIDIMPSTQWTQTLLGIDEDSAGEWGMGSEFQWLLMVVLVMFAITYATESAIVGIGTGSMSIVVLWIAGYVGIGAFLSSVSFAILMAIYTQGVGNDTKIEVNTGERFG